MALASVEYTCPQTQTNWKISASNTVELRLGADRTSLGSAQAELLWFQERFSELSQIMPNQNWSVFVDMSRVAVSRNQTLALQELFTDMLKNDKIKTVAVVQAARTFQVAIRKVLINIKAIGKLKFFEQKETAREWLSLKNK